MKRTWKSMLSVVLALSMVLTMLGVSAMATEAEEGPAAVVEETVDQQPVENEAEPDANGADEVLDAMEVESERELPTVPEEETTPLIPVLMDAAEKGLDPAPVAKIGDTEYQTLDEAIAAAEAMEGAATIEVLSDCTMEKGIFLGTEDVLHLTIQGVDGSAKPTITFKDLGIALFKAPDGQRSLTFQDCDVQMDAVGSTPYTAEWGWATICAQPNVNIELINADMTLDGDPDETGTLLPKQAIYLCGSDEVTLTDSNLVIKNYKNSALSWDGDTPGYNGTTGQYNVTMTNSSYLADNTYSGFVGTFAVHTKDSTVDVINSHGNGANGSHFYFEDSTVNFSENGSHGLSAGALSIKNSQVTVHHNGLCGVAVNGSGDMYMDGTSTMTITDNCYKTWAASSAFRMYGKARKALVEDGAVLTITGNQASGIESYRPTVIEEGVALTITNNSIMVNNDDGTSGKGGGVYTYRSMQLPSDAVIYNNHALNQGDDLYCDDNAEGKITFGKVGSDWALDGDPDCTHAIDGWYDDAQDARWSAHQAPLHMQEFTEFENGLAAVTGGLALKAAHGAQYQEPIQPQPENPDWEISKSKEAENLEKVDGKYQSRVTLSMPSAQEELVSDVVFVFDESSCSAPVKAEVSKMMNDLYAHVQESGAAIKVGAVQFRGETTLFDLALLNENTAADLAEFMGQRPGTGGSNMSMGLLAGKAMLDADEKVDAARKYLILVSDGITYIWDDETTTEPENTGVNFSNADFTDRPFLASPDGWDVKYGNGFVPDDWSTFFDDALIEKTVEEKSSAYVRGADISDDPFVKPDEQSKYVSTVDIALYKSLLAYNAIADAGYHTFVVNSGVASEMRTYPYGPSFMDYMAGGKTVSFDEIEREIYYLLDAGSKVLDVMGYGVDNQGNEYNMDFVNDPEKIFMTVGGKTLAAEDINVMPLGSFENPDKLPTAIYGFDYRSDIADYSYVLCYYQDGYDEQFSDECFVWIMNVPVTNFETVQLHYSVELTNPQTGYGSYGEYDRFGTEGHASLYTNESAVLYPVDSEGVHGTPEAFLKPTVSYEISRSGGGGGGGSRPDPRPEPKPDPETELPDPEVPLDPAPTDPAQPVVPVEPGVEIPEENVPLVPAVPETGDPMAVYMTLTGLSGLALLAMKKRKDDQE